MGSGFDHFEMAFADMDIIIAYIYNTARHDDNSL